MNLWNTTWQMLGRSFTAGEVFADVTFPLVFTALSLGCIVGGLTIAHNYKTGWGVFTVLAGTVPASMGWVAYQTMQHVYTTPATMTPSQRHQLLLQYGAVAETLRGCVVLVGLCALYMYGLGSVLCLSGRPKMLATGLMMIGASGPIVFLTLVLLVGAADLRNVQNGGGTLTWHTVPVWPMFLLVPFLVASVVASIVQSRKARKAALV